MTPLCLIWGQELQDNDCARNGIGKTYTKKSGKSLTNPKNRRILGVLNIK